MEMVFLNETKLGVKKMATNKMTDVYTPEERKRRQDEIDAIIEKANKAFHDSCFDKEEDEDEYDAGDEWFNRKFPNACCNRCDESLNAKTVRYCGGGGGACETWYCEGCLEEGTYDCEVCVSDEDYEVICVYCKNGLTREELDERTEKGIKSVCFDCIPSGASEKD
jgi:hypothetical protein